MKRPLLALLFALAAGLASAAQAWADDTLDVVAQFEFQSPQPSTSGTFSPPWVSPKHWWTLIPTVG